MKIACSHDAIVDIAQLVPHPQNPNKHPQDQIKRLAKIIDFQGQRSPIVVSKRSGFMIVGHGRLEAMKELKWDKVAVNYQDFESEAQEYAHMTADNGIGQWSDLDLSQINIDMTDLGPDFDIDMLGIEKFTIEPLDNLDDITKDIRDDLNAKFIIEVTFPNDMEMMDIHDDLVSRGYMVKVKK